MDLKNGPKRVQKLTKVDHHSQRITRDADDGRKNGARRTVLRHTIDVATIGGGGSEAMGRDKGRGKPLPMGHREVHVTCLASLLTTAAQRAGGILGMLERF